MTTAARTFLRIRVAPRASRNMLSRDRQGVLRAHLTAAPVDGAANRALVALLAERLDLPKTALEISRGTRGRDKVVCVHGWSERDLDQRIAVALGSDVDKDRARG